MLRELFKKNKLKRALEDRSAREIADFKKKLGSELRASLYVYNKEKFIICAIAGIAEYGEPVVLDVNATDSDIGLALCDKLLEFKVRGEEPRPSGKLEDWQAYQVSGANTGKSFENKSMFVYFRTVNSAINMDAAPRVSLEKNLKAHCSISNGCSYSEIGREIRKVIEAANVLRQAKML